MLCLSGFERYSRWVPLIFAVLVDVARCRCCQQDGEKGEEDGKTLVCAWQT